MPRELAVLALFLSSAAVAQSAPEAVPTLRSILLEELKTTHSVEEWFVPSSIALADLTPEQANWTPGDGHHSVAQLATHLVYWNKRALDQFKGVDPGKGVGDNKETFTPVDAATWPATVRQLDQILIEWESIVATADEAKLRSVYSTIAHIATHNAYHLGQVLYVRKLAGNWNPEKGVK